MQSSTTYLRRGCPSQRQEPRLYFPRYISSFLPPSYFDDGFDAGNISISHLFPSAFLPLFFTFLSRHVVKISVLITAVTSYMITIRDKVVRNAVNTVSDAHVASTSSLMLSCLWYTERQCQNMHFFVGLNSVGLFSS